MIFKGSGFPVLLGLPGLKALGFHFGMSNSLIDMLPLMDQQGTMNVVVDSDIVLQPFALMGVRLDLSCIQAAATKQKFCAQAVAGWNDKSRDIGVEAQEDKQDEQESGKEWPRTGSHPKVYVIEQDVELAECGVVLDNSVHEAVQNRTNIPLHLRNFSDSCTIVPEGTVLGTIKLAPDSDVRQVNELTITQLDKLDFMSVNTIEEMPRLGTKAHATAMMPVPTTVERKNYVRENMPKPEQLTATQAR
jgi:hypothetical protein